MTDPDFASLSAQHELGDSPIPAIVSLLAGVHIPELVWRNELGGLTFRIGKRFVKWNPYRTGIDLALERRRLEWLAGRHPAPIVLDYGEDAEAQWLLTREQPGEAAVGDIWRSRSSEAIKAIAVGLQAIHRVPINDFPREWTKEVWVGQSPSEIGPRPALEHPVLVHGDACAPNTLISAAGKWVGNVDFGDLAVGDRWADLAIASLSLDWNFGAGHQDEFFTAYGVKPDNERIMYYRALWEAES